MKRLLIPWLTVLAMLLSGSLAAAGQGATPTDGTTLASLGYPEMRIVVNDEGAETPAEVPAGRILVVLENQGSPDGPAAVSDVNILKLPAGVALEELNALMTSGGGETPAWFADIDSIGGFNVAAGETGVAVVDLEPGEWYIGVGEGNPYAPLTATGDMPPAAEDPPADLSLDVHEFTLGLPEQLPAGPQVWHVANTGEQLHEIQLIRTPELLTIEQVMTILSLPEGEPPPEGVPDPATFEFLPDGAKSMSPGREIWVELDLAPGNYVAICGTLDTETGQPHAALGEAQDFTVSD